MAAMMAIVPPLLPQPMSWFPGHMVKFTRMLPALLKRTDVVIEIRDSRLPLTSINRNLEGALQKWRAERGWDAHNPTRRNFSDRICERVIVFNKRDLVPEWGLEPFCKAMAVKFPGQRTLFASWHKHRDIRRLSELLVSMAKEYPQSTEMNVLVIGMPNVGKSTLLNALRSAGIDGPTPKALRTSAQPGLTQAVSTRLKISADPLIYAFDSPGVMLPYLGHGPEGAERGVKLALIAGIKESLYDMETLASYLLYRLNVLNPMAPTYLQLLPPGSKPISDLEEFLSLLAHRMRMIRRGGELDLSRAATHFVRWWREDGALIYAKAALVKPDLPGSIGDDWAADQRSNAHGTVDGAVHGWGFDLQWSMKPGENFDGATIQRHMEECIDDYLTNMERAEKDETFISPTQRKILEKKQRRIKQLR